MCNPKHSVATNSTVTLHAFEHTRCTFHVFSAYNHLWRASNRSTKFWGIHVMFQRDTMIGHPVLGLFSLYITPSTPIYSPFRHEISFERRYLGTTGQLINRRTLRKGGSMHAGTCDSREALVQERGDAGRDTAPAPPASWPEETTSDQSRWLGVLRPPEHQREASHRTGYKF